MPQQQYIRFLREQEGCSIQEISERVGVNWRTAKKYADRDNWSPSLQQSSGRYPMLGPYIEIIDIWLEENEQLPRKQQQTAKNIFERLKKEYGYSGCDRNVREYVRKKKEKLKLNRAQCYQRLEHPGGEAQVDFGTIFVAKDSCLVEQKLLVASFPYSNAAFVYPVPKENQECFLEALKQVFHQMKGVPRRIWFDNLSAAVVSVEKDGQRNCTDAFLRFLSHYRFEAVFCNPNSGHEKGHVENKVGYSRRNWCVPPPVVSTHEELVQLLTREAQADRQRLHYIKARSIEDLWQEEKSKPLILPPEPYEVFRLEGAQVNKYGEIRFENTSFPVPYCSPGRSVLLKIFWDRFEVLDDNHQSLACFPRPYMEKTLELDWKSILAGLRKRPRAV